MLSKIVDYRDILIADDTMSFTEAVKDYFEMHGFTADVANVPEDVIEKATKNKFRFILMDYNFKAKLTGVDIIKRLKELKVKSRIIANSGDDEHNDEMIKLGAINEKSSRYSPNELINKLKLIKED